jgi:phosphoglycerate dehydrogenase-like enzyme
MQQTGTEALDTEVLIVGLGPVGASLANLLALYGVRVVAMLFPVPR